MRIRILLMGLLLAAVANAQTVYHDASTFPLLGKATESTLTRYERLPDSLQNISRKPLWDLGRNSAGLAVRFRSNSTSISAKWEVRNNMSMNHMTPTGIKGLDLYCLQDGKWIFAGSGRPQGKVNKATIVSNMLPEEREYLLYLSLYDGVTSLSIGVDSLAEITQPAVDLPQREKPVVFYGTSILQGGCASRPGMAHTNILERWLNRECINLGFSGNALLDLEIADVTGRKEIDVFLSTLLQRTEKGIQCLILVLYLLGNPGVKRRVGKERVFHEKDRRIGMLAADDGIEFVSTLLHLLHSGIGYEVKDCGRCW